MSQANGADALQPFAFDDRSSLRGKWGLCIGITLVAICFALLPDTQFRYERQGDFLYQPWRLLTAHLTHLSALHLFYNLAGLALICELLWNRMPIRHGIVAMLLAAAIINLLLWRSHPEVLWYAGLSGVLHALWAACVTLTLLNWGAAGDARYQLAALIAAALLVVKLILERADVFFVPMAQDGMFIIDVVHAYGAIAGLGYTLIWQVVQKICGGK